MFSQTSGRVFATVSGFLVPFILISYTTDFTFHSLKYGLISICFVFDVVSFICSYLIPNDFIPGAKHNMINMLAESNESNGEKNNNKDGNEGDSNDIGLTTLLESDSDEKKEWELAMREKSLEKERDQILTSDAHVIATSIQFHNAASTTTSPGKTERASGGVNSSSGLASHTSAILYALTPTVIRRTVNTYAKTPLIWTISIQINCVAFVVGFFAIIFRFDLATSPGID
jgi:hypothetical protein